MEDHDRINTIERNPIAKDPNLLFFLSILNFKKCKNDIFSQMTK